MSRFVILDGKPVPADAASDSAPGSLPRRPTLALIDPHALRRALVQQMLERWADGLRVEGYASSADLAAAGDGAADGLGMIVLSLGGAPLVGSEVAAELQAVCSRFDRVPVVVMSDREDSRDIVLACHLGARGYLPTTLEPLVAQEVLHLVRAGGTYLPAKRLVEELDAREAVTADDDAPATDGAAAAPCGPPVTLTRRQEQVLRLLCQGKPNKVIAQDLGMEESTVKVHVRHIMRKLGASNRTEVALRAQQTIFVTE